MTSNGRVARLTALALATGTLVAANASGATAADSNTKNVFDAVGGGSVIHLALNLPVAVNGITSITQDLVVTGSHVQTASFTAKGAAITQSFLGANGNIPVVSPLLAKTHIAEFGKPQPADDNVLPANPLISGSALSLVSKALNPDVDNALPIAHSSSSVTNLAIDPAGNLTAVLDSLVASLTTTLTGVIGTTPAGTAAAPVAGVTTTVTGLLDTVSAALPAALPANATQAVKDAVAQVSAALNALPALLATSLKAKTADTSLLSIGTVLSDQKITRNAGVVTSTATNQLLGIKLLGGLISVGSVTSEATASLGSAVKSAQASGHRDLLNFNLDNLLTIDVTGALETALGGSLVPAEVKAAVNQALASVTGLLQSALGTTLETGKSSQSTSADKATSSRSAASIRVQPNAAAAPLIELSLAPATATVSKVLAQQAIAPTVTTVAAKPQLPRTGANLPLTGVVATSLVGLAMVARRRRSAHLGA
jgi:hypothetical protein